MSTFPELLIKNKNIFKTSAIRAKCPNSWEEYTWSRLYLSVSKMMIGLGSLGVGKNTKIAITATNAPETIIACDAAQALGAIPVILYPSTLNNDMLLTLKDMGIQYAVVNGRKQLDLLFEPNSYALSKIICISPDELDDYNPNIVVNYKNLLSDMYLNQEYFPELFDNYVTKINKEDTAFIFVSSATRMSKSRTVSWSYEDLHTTALAVKKCLQLNNCDEVLFADSQLTSPQFLLWYIFSHHFGACLICPENHETVFEDICEGKPTILFAPPNILQHITMLLSGQVSNLKVFFTKTSHDNTQRKLNRLIQKLIEVTVYAPIKNANGLGHLRYAISDGDSLDKITNSFFRVLRIPLLRLQPTVESSSKIELRISDNPF